MVNTLGLIILVGFLGYGLVEVPRSLWNKGDVAGQLRYLQFKVAVQSEELQSARRKLEETLELVHSTDAQLKEEARAASTQSFTRMQKHMTTMLSLCSKARAPPCRARAVRMKCACRAHAVCMPCACDVHAVHTPILNLADNSLVGAPAERPKPGAPTLPNVAEPTSNAAAHRSRGLPAWAPRLPSAPMGGLGPRREEAEERVLRRRSGAGPKSRSSLGVGPAAAERPPLTAHHFLL
tara:strand:- start:17 stop:727 length:711 start_codon:yes stop_codon:yes gene_type:complete